MHGLLNGRSIGLVFLGSSSDQINSLVRAAVTQAGGDLATVVAVREPLDLSGLGRAAEGTRYAALAGSASASPASGEGASTEAQSSKFQANWSNTSARSSPSSWSAVARTSNAS